MGSIEYCILFHLAVQFSLICTNEQLVGEKAISRPGRVLVRDTGAREQTLTWGFGLKVKSHLKGARDSVQVLRVVDLVHGEPVTILDGSIAKGEAYYPAKLHRMYPNDNLGYYNGFQLPQPGQGLSRG